MTAKMKSNPVTEIEFHYLKSPSFRMIHVDGAYGGVTPRGLIVAHLFSERPPIPQQLIHSVTPDGKLGSETRKVGKEGVIREVEAGIILDVREATSLVKWLQQKIDLIKQQGKGEE